eukprot:TRINITY_DN7328_c0_g2_i2.p1 TRINITY_DN7328_c0_g2~~TRINITY_DN7328_c0_g2_i2.p1  ORF type:complete len:894 (+),score=248.08 TRINITY_DN7328_c0_g2_i2:74-2755(+)
MGEPPPGVAPLRAPSTTGGSLRRELSSPPAAPPLLRLRPGGLSEGAGTVHVDTPQCSTGRAYRPGALPAGESGRRIPEQLGFTERAARGGISCLTRGLNGLQQQLAELLQPPVRPEEPPETASHPLSGARGGAARKREQPEQAQADAARRRFSVHARELQGLLQLRQEQGAQQLAWSADPQGQPARPRPNAAPRARKRPEAVRTPEDADGRMRRAEADAELEQLLRQGQLVGYHDGVAALLAEQAPAGQQLQPLSPTAGSLAPVQPQRPTSAARLRPLHQKLAWLRGSTQRRRLFNKQVKASPGQQREVRRVAPPPDPAAAIESSAALTAAARDAVERIGGEAASLSSQCAADAGRLRVEAAQRQPRTQPPPRSPQAQRREHDADLYTLFARDAVGTVSTSVAEAEGEIGAARGTLDHLGECGGRGEGSPSTPSLSSPLRPRAAVSVRPTSAGAARSAVGAARQAAARATRAAEEALRSWALTTRLDAKERRAQLRPQSAERAAAAAQCARLWALCAAAALGIGVFGQLAAEIAESKALEEDAGRREAAARTIQRGLCGRVRQFRLDRAYVCMHRLQAAGLGRVIAAHWRRRRRLTALPIVEHALSRFRGSLALRVRVQSRRWFKSVRRLQLFMRHCLSRREMQLGIMTLQWKITELLLIAERDAQDASRIRSEVRQRAKELGVLHQRGRASKVALQREQQSFAARKRAAQLADDQSPMGALLRLQAWTLKDEQLRQVAEEVGYYRRPLYQTPQRWRRQKLLIQLRRKRRDYAERIAVWREKCHVLRSRRERAEAARTHGRVWQARSGELCSPTSAVEPDPPRPEWVLSVDSAALEQYIVHGWKQPPDASIPQSDHGQRAAARGQQPNTEATAPQPASRPRRSRSTARRPTTH